MLVVLGGTYVAILGWAFFLHTLHQQIASYSPYAAMILMAVLIGIIIIGHFLQRTIHENKNRHHIKMPDESEQNGLENSEEYQKET